MPMQKLGRKRKGMIEAVVGRPLDRVYVTHGPNGHDMLALPNSDDSEILLVRPVRDRFGHFLRYCVGPWTETRTGWIPPHEKERGATCPCVQEP